MKIVLLISLLAFSLADWQNGYYGTDGDPAELWGGV
jgi:hypothetical protein